MKRYEGKMKKNYEGKMEKYVPLYIGRKTSKNFEPSSGSGGGNLTRIRFLRWHPVPKGKVGLPPKHFIISDRFGLVVKLKTCLKNGLLYVTFKSFKMSRLAP